jgi:hypothetical protein
MWLEWVDWLVVLENTGSRRRCDVVGNRLKSHPVADFILTLLNLRLLWNIIVVSKFFRRTDGDTLFDHKRNEEILEDLN